MTLGNMRELGVYRLLVSCVNPQCLHEALIDVSSYWADTTVPSFIPRMKCSWCGGTSLCFTNTSPRRVVDLLSIAADYIR
jgi:hypothetical protein